MTIEEARTSIIEAIQAVYDGDEAKNIAELLMERITNLPLIERILRKSESLTAKQKQILDQSIIGLQNHEPIQYIINEAWFAGMKFYVDKNVLIPRPETEELVEWVVRECKTEKGKRIKILDVGTGSGCIAIALKTKLPGVEMWACDISDAALNVARMNADAVHAAIDFVPVDFLDPGQREQLPHVDIIVSNPPYVPQKEINEIRKNVVNYEPTVALFVSNENPLTFYNAIADFGKDKLNEQGTIYAEIHESLGQEVKNLFLANGFCDVEIRKDMQGKERMIKVYPHGPDR